MRPDASENSQISPSTIVRAARAAGSHPHLASVLLQGRKSANIYASSGVIRGIPVRSQEMEIPSRESMEIRAVDPNVTDEIKSLQIAYWLQHH
jgi:hypothetical protein